MDKLCKVTVYEFAKYNDNDIIIYNNHNQFALKKEYTWGIHDLERNIRSYKMSLPLKKDKVNRGNTIIYGPIITLIDINNNYYNFNEYSMEELPDKIYTRIIIQISHIPIKYELEVGNEIVEYYDNNKKKVIPIVDDDGGDLYNNVYQIKIQHVEMLKLIGSDETSRDSYMFFSSVIYLPAYTKNKTNVTQDDFTEHDYLEYVNESKQKPLQFIGLHNFHPRESFYSYTFYQFVNVRMELINANKDDLDAQIQKLRVEYLKLVPIIKRTTDENVLLELNKRERKLREEIKTKEQEEQRLKSNVYTADFSKSEEELEKIAIEVKLTQIDSFNKTNVPYIITYSESNQKGNFIAYRIGRYSYINDVIGSLFLKDCIVYLYDEKNKKTVHVLSGDIDKKKYLIMEVEEKPSNFEYDTFMQEQEQVFNARVPHIPPVTIEYLDENNEMNQMELHITLTPLVTTDKEYVVKSIDILDGYGVLFNDESIVRFKNSLDPLPEKLHKIQVFTIDNIPEIPEKIPIVQENKNMKIESVRTTSEQIDADVWIEYYDPSSETKKTMILEVNKEMYFDHNTFLINLNMKQGCIVTLNGNLTYFYDSFFREQPMRTIRYVKEDKTYSRLNPVDTQSFQNNEIENQHVFNNEIVKQNEEAERIRRENKEAERQRRENEEQERIRRENEEQERIRRENEEQERITKENEAERIRRENEAEAERRRRIEKDGEELERKKKEEEMFWFIVKIIVTFLLLLLLIYVLFKNTTFRRQ